MSRQGPDERIAVVVKGYPRLSETFIAQEILALENRGFDVEIWSLRRPTDKYVHPMHNTIRAPLRYLPEYLYREPIRVLLGMLWALGQPRFRGLLRLFWRDWRRDLTANRGRRFGQACVMGRELSPHVRHVHVHYLHTPASVVRYATALTGRSWTYSAHAKDIWTTPDWEKREKLADSLWGVTCTAEAAAHLRSLAPDAGRVDLVYHGLDLGRFPPPPEARPARDGSDPDKPIRILSIGRAVPKKGFDDLLKALTALPPDLHWRFAHVGGGELLETLKSAAQEAGIAKNITFLGQKAQPEIVALLRDADLFVLPAKQATSGDRDGLPNVLLEAASQGLAIIATNFAGIPEFIQPGIEGELVPPGDWEGLSNAINLLARDPTRRSALGAAAYRRLREDFSMEGGIALLERKFREIAGPARSEQTADVREPA